MSDELKLIEGGVSAPNAVLTSLTMTGITSLLQQPTLEVAPGMTAIIGPNGSGKCSRKGTMVTLADGSARAIESLVDAALAGAVPEVLDDGFQTFASPEAIRVMTLDPKSLRLESRPVTAFVKRR